MPFNANLLLSLLAGDVQGRVAVGGGRVHERAVPQQQRNDVGVGEAGGDVQRRLLLLGARVDGGAVAQQDAHDVGLVGARRQVQGRLAAHRGHVGQRAVLDEEDDHVQAAHEAGHVQGGQARLGCGLFGGAVLGQQLNDLDEREEMRVTKGRRKTENFRDLNCLMQYN